MSQSAKCVVVDFPRAPQAQPLPVRLPKLTEEELAFLRGFVARCGSLRRATTVLGVTREPLARVLAGLNTRAGSVSLIREAIKAHREANA